MGVAPAVLTAVSVGQNSGSEYDLRYPNFNVRSGRRSSSA